LPLVAFYAKNRKMKKQEVELILLKVAMNGDEALFMKIYKNGTLIRHGVGGLPRLGISAMSVFETSPCFDTLLSRLPGELIEDPLHYTEETPHGALEYLLACYGVSANGETGEQAEWTKSTGIRFLLDAQTSFSHPVLGFLDHFVMDAAELTNEWYFDIMVHARYGALSSALPAQTMVAQPQTEEEIHTQFENYINQMLQSTRRWDMNGFTAHKTYAAGGDTYTGVVQQNATSFRVDFLPQAQTAAEPAADPPKKKGWKFW